MAQISSSFLVETLLEGGSVNVFIPKGGTRFYHVQFRVRDVTRASGWRQVLRSCGTAVYEDAKVKAADIFVEEAARGKKPVLGPTAAGKPEPAVIVTDATITEVVGHHKVWMASAIPGERRPSLSTAHTYRPRTAH